MNDQLILYLLAAAVALLLAGYAGRWLLQRYSQVRLLRPRPLNRAAPRVTNLPLQTVTIHSGKKCLLGWLLQPDRARDRRKTVLIFHDGGQTRADWLPVMRYLWEQGVSSLAFDYRGFGDSDGPADVTSLRQDASAALRTLMGRVSVLHDKYVLGFGLGAGVMLAPAAEYPNFINGAILVGPYTHLGQALPEKGSLDAWALRTLQGKLPGIFNSRSEVGKLQIPVLVLHGTAGSELPTGEVEAIYAAAPQPKSLVLLENLSNQEMLNSGTGAFLEPVLAFIHGAQPEI